MGKQQDEPVIVNEGNNRYIISYDLRAEAEITNEDFRKMLLHFLFDQGCNQQNIKSYTDSCVLFTLDEALNFDYLKRAINIQLGEYITYVLAEIEKREIAIRDRPIGSYKSIRKAHQELYDNFNQLVIDEYAIWEEGS